MMKNTYTYTTKEPSQEIFNSIEKKYIFIERVNPTYMLVMNGKFEPLFNVVFNGNELTIVCINPMVRENEEIENFLKFIESII